MSVVSQIKISCVLLYFDWFYDSVRIVVCYSVRIVVWYSVLRIVVCSSVHNVVFRQDKIFFYLNCQLLRLSDILVCEH